MNQAGASDFGGPGASRSPGIPPVNPEMLVLARESRGLTQKDLCDKTGISQGLLSKYENGLLQIPKSALSTLANVLEYPDIFFTRDNRRTGLSVSFVFHRKKTSLPAKSLRKIEADINIQAIGVERLLQSLDADCSKTFIPMDVMDYDGDATHVAQLLRAHWRLPMGPIGNLVEVIEAAGGIVFRCAFETNKLDGLSLWLGSTPLFFLNSACSGDRSRFSLAHELGHIIMHRIPTPNLEDEANAFAAEFLMPAAEIGPDLSQFSITKAASLKPVWKTSMAAIIRRAHTLNKISYHQYQRLCIEMGAAGYRTREPLPVSVEEPKAFKQILDVYKKDFGYSISNIAEALGLYPQEVQAKFLAAASPMHLV